MTRWLLDTSIVSDAVQKTPNPAIARWLSAQYDQSLFISALTLAEIARGILEVPAGARRTRLMAWFSGSTGPAHLFELRQGPHRVLVSDFGVTVTSWFVDDTDIVLGFDEVGDYERHSPYFGCIVGRYANRIAHGRFCLDGQAYELATNNAPGDMPCHLHGGPEGFHRRLWDAQPQGGEEPSVVFSRVSPNGEEGYPGNLEVRVAVQLRRDGGLRFTTWAKTDRATPFSLTHHGYFNLAVLGAGLADKGAHVDQAGGDHLTVHIDDLGAFRRAGCAYVLARLLDDAVRDQDVAALVKIARRIDHARVGEQERAIFVPRDHRNTRRCNTLKATQSATMSATTPALRATIIGFAKSSGRKSHRTKR